MVVSNSPILTAKEDIKQSRDREVLGAEPNSRERILGAAINHFSEAGITGARIDAICKEANVNVRMVYHYFGDKEALYLAVLDHVMAQLRDKELKINIDSVSPLDGLLQMFEFTYQHFTDHPEFVRLLSAENLMNAKYLNRSQKIRSGSSPLVEHIRTLLHRGTEDRTIRPNIDPVQYYVIMVGLCYFHRSNGYTLSAIFGTNMKDPDWDRNHRDMARDTLVSYLKNYQQPA